MKVKICGLKTSEAIEAAVTAGADYLGFVFAESKRKISPVEAFQLTKNLAKKIKKVGVFVSPTLAELQEISQAAGLDFLQIHGELPEEIETLQLPTIRAVSVVDGVIAKKIFQEHYDYLLLDAPPKEFIGGNGEVFDWSAVKKTELPAKPLFVAGGLTAENVQAAKKYFQPFAVDVSSGVETNGEKDVAKIAAFIKAAKQE